VKDINHPRHYNECGERDEDGSAKFEAIKIIEDWGLGFCLGNAVKYICRAPHKGCELQDLEKALWYISRACEHPESIKVLTGRRFNVAEVAEAWRLDGHLTMALGRIAEGHPVDAEMALRGRLEELR